MTALIAMLLGIALQSTLAPALPATPQGKQVEAFIKALRTSEAACVAFQSENTLPKRAIEQDKTMYGRIRKAWGDFTVLSV